MTKGILAFQIVLFQAFGAHAQTGMVPAVPASAQMPSHLPSTLAPPAGSFALPEMRPPLPSAPGAALAPNRLTGTYAYVDAEKIMLKNVIETQQKKIALLEARIEELEKKSK